MGYCQTSKCKKIADIKDIIGSPPPHFGEDEDDLKRSMIPQTFAVRGISLLCAPCLLEASIEDLRRGAQDRN